MKTWIGFATTLAIITTAFPAQAGFYSTEGEDYGDIYSTRGNRDMYTTADDRQGLYTTENSGSIYSTSDKREGLYTSEETPRSEDSGGVTGAELMDSAPASSAGSVYNGYMPGQ